MTPSLSGLRAEGVLSPLDEHFARVLARLSGEAREDVLLAAALASHRVEQGHVCLDLPGLAAEGTEGLVPETGEETAVAVAWPDADAWLAQVGESPLVAASSEAAGGASPLVLDPEGRLYLRRYWEHEQRLAAALRGRLASPVPAGEVDDALLARGLDRLFPLPPARAVSAGEEGEAEGKAPPDRQRVAAERALRSRFCVISGGPGTGKTTTVVRLLALAVEQALARGARAPRIALAAPTGKAAARLIAAVRAHLGGLDCEDAVRDAMPDRASTLHRLLGAARGGGGRFAHHAGRPLAVDWLVVDEASMVDLALMDALVAATPERARLVLLGDRDQLASVEAGSVLADICSVDGAGGAVVPFVELVRSHRFGAGSGIAALCRAVNAGEADAALALLDDPERPDVWLEPPLETGLPEALGAEVHARWGALSDARVAPGERLAALEGLRILCAHRRGPGGVEIVNRAVEQTLARAGCLRPTDGHYPGRPLLVTRNDYELDLYNGDVGLVVTAPGAAGGARGPRAIFPAADGGLRDLSALRIGSAETVFAMSIHKSQGSEFDRVAVCLPPAGSPLLTRELVYTAVSRAREGVSIHAARDVLADAIRRRVTRASGLARALHGGSGVP